MSVTGSEELLLKVGSWRSRVNGWDRNIVIVTNVIAVIIFYWSIIIISESLPLLTVRLLCLGY
jgi:hypothetical protein